MFVDYYKLRQQPFGTTPDPRFLYMSRSHSEALASLWYGLREGRGFTALAAPPGMGKTTLLFHLLGYLRSRARTVFLFQTQCDPRELLRYLLSDMGLAPGPDLAAMHAQLNQVMLEEARAGRRLVVMVDEAQNLSDSVLETIRLLSDFESSQRKLLQIILSGQPQLVRTLMRPEVEQLRQRISLLNYLQPFNRQEIEEYIAHRLRIAGRTDKPLFSSEAVEVIAEGSGGIPRNINNLCFQSLSIGCALRQKLISREIAEEAVADQKFESALSTQNIASPAPVEARAEVAQAMAPALESPPRPRFRKAAIAAAVLVAMILGTAAAYAGRGHLSFLHALRPKPAVPRTETLISTGPGAVISADERENSNASNASRSPEQLVIVEPNQTLFQISMLHLGDYNAAILAKLRELNPGLGDPDHLEVGQQIRLPAGSSGDAANKKSKGRGVSRDTR